MRLTFFSCVRQLVIPALGFVAARWYLKRLIHACVGLNAATTFLWAMIPFFPFDTETSRFGALLLLAIFLALKLYILYLFFRLFWLVRYTRVARFCALEGVFAPHALLPAPAGT